jgi:nicotinamide phosphoribosyltransferase
MILRPELLIDGYKLDHKRQYPDNTTLIFSNFTARKSRRDLDNIVFFGLQYFIKEYLINGWGEFFKQDFNSVADKFSREIDSYLGPNQVGIHHLFSLHNLGYLPIKIMALPEGSIVPIKVPPLVIYNTHPDFSWLVNYLETLLSATLWGACTSATTAFEYKKLLTKYAKETDHLNVGFVDFQAHDFSMRGMFGLEAAMISGAAHLTSFKGSDTLPAIDFIKEYYHGELAADVIAMSVPATEHSVMCAGGKDTELDTIHRLITKVYPSGIVSIVSDTWDFWHTLTFTSNVLKTEIMARDGKVVFRPDSGDPVKIICGDSDADLSCANKGAIECLWDIFGGTVNSQGYKVLDSHIGLIYGDSITLERAKQICEGLKRKGFASTNIVLGIGSYTYQHVTRDTDGWAMKATYAEIDGKPVEIFKDPLTDSGIKKSAKGLLAVYENNETYELKEQASWAEVNKCAFRVIFENGEINSDQSLGFIRERLNDRT